VIELDLYDPTDRSLHFVNMAELMAMTEVDHLRDQVAHLTVFLYETAFGPDWRDAAPTCRCGKRMLVARRPYGNSGTTRVTFACADAVLYKYDIGHQWAVTTSPEHWLDTDGGKCCGGLIESLKVVP
jgi:hypothetical protein